MVRSGLGLRVRVLLMYITGFLLFLLLLLLIIIIQSNWAAVNYIRPTSCS